MASFLLYSRVVRSVSQQEEPFPSVHCCSPVGNGRCNCLRLYQLGLERKVRDVFDRPRVLIIDEDRRTVDRLQEHFVQSGYEAEIALSGPVGLSIIEERRMDAAVLNAAMGHHEDWALVKSLKHFAPSLPLVLFNGPKVKGLSREAKRAGVSRFLIHPTDAQEIISETLKVLNS